MQKFAHRLLGVLAGLCLCVSAGATTTVTGKLQTLGTGNITSGAFVRFYLRGCAGNQPRVNGTALIGPTQGAVFYFDIAADASGNISGTLYSTRDAAGTGNGDIECGGSKTGVWYGMVAFQGGRGGPEVPVHAKSGVSLDITSVTPITTNPVTTAPTGDTTYLRLDGGNAMTGGLAAPIYLSLTETSAPAAASGSDLIYGDSSAHRAKVKNNNGSADTLALFTDKLSAFAATTSAELASVLSDETGSGGGFVRATSPALTTPSIASAALSGTHTGASAFSGLQTFSGGIAGLGFASVLCTTDTSAGASMGDLLTLPAITTRGGKVIVSATVPASAASASGQFTFSADGSDSLVLALVPTTWGGGNVTIMKVFSPAAGSHTYKLRYAAPAGTLAVNCSSVANGAMYAMEVSQ